MLQRLALLSPVAFAAALLVSAGSAPPVADDKAELGKLPERWSEHVTVADLTDEISESATRMAQNLKKPSDFDKFLKNINTEGHLTAILAALVLEHPEADGWKGVAAEIQSQALTVAKAAEAKGGKNFRTAQDAYKKITELLKKADGGTKGSSADASTEPTDWTSLGALSDVMKRVEVSYKYIRGKMSSESAFKKEAETIRHYSAMLYIFGQISPSFRPAEKDMVSLCGTMSNAAVNMLAAVNGTDYAKANEANAALNNSCNECHKVKRFQKKGSDFDF